MGILLCGIREVYTDSSARNVRSIVISRAVITSISVSLPVLASVITFIVYGINHSLDPATIFTSVTLFNVLLLPLMFFSKLSPFTSMLFVGSNCKPPIASGVNASIDAHNALGHIQELFEAESLPNEQVKHAELEGALELNDASFVWDTPFPEPNGKGGKETRGPEKNKVSTSKKLENKVFKIQKTSLKIPKGRIVAIVGPVGSGKSSLLQGLIGEMRRESGSVRFCGSVSYCPQNAWIQVYPLSLYNVWVALLNGLQNATIHENVCLGRMFDPDRYWRAISDSCLDSDLKLFPNGDLMEVGERGISLSGGQKQHINICRAVYCGADVQIFDVSPF